MSVRLIRDYIQVKNQPTVVRLSALESNDSAWIVDSYYLSEGISGHLKILRHHLGQPCGVGIFLVGHYGSGKSHFLAYLCQKLLAGEFAAAPEPIPISLLNHPSDISLEKIVALALGITEVGSDRRGFWKAVIERHPRGLFLVLDELSEFLRSKPTQQCFNEDIRFLQFLGEWAAENRLWVLCAMQEQIEHTGAIEGDLYRKIKDRFPVRLLLTPTHVKDFIGNGLLMKAPGFETALEDWFHDLKTTFPVKIDFDEMRQTYPLHPTVLDILEEIRDQFSQARGVVDFTVKQLLGDPSLERPAFLDRPFGELLTADRIVDHFSDLLELQPEFQTLSQKVLPYYRENMEKLFLQEAPRKTAWKLLNLLMLVHLSPRRQVLTAKEATWWLLQRISRLDPGKNEQFLRHLLDKMVDEGAFIGRRGSGFFLNLTDDSRPNLEKILEKTVKELRGQGDSLFERLIPLLEEAPFSPFTFKPREWQNFTFVWHLHSRNVLVFLSGGALEKNDSELRIQVGLPWGPPPTSFPAVVPKPIEITDDIVELAALVQLRERPLAENLLKKLDQMLFSRRSFLFQKIQMSYAQGSLNYSDGYCEQLKAPDIQKTFRDWLSHCCEKILKRKYPQFERYAPTFGPLPAQAFQELMEYARDHELTDEAAPERIRIIREGYLCPMGLLQRKERTYQAAPLNRHDLVNFVYQILPHRPSPEVIYESLSQPVYGLVPEQIHCLLLYLYLEGEIEISKGSKSYRECYNELPLPIQYDKLSTGRGLSLEQIEKLEKICDGLNLDYPSRWGIVLQRRMVERLRKIGLEQSQRLHRFILRINDLDMKSLQGEVERILGYWRTLEKDGDEIATLQQFLYEIESSGNFVALYQKLESLPERFESLWRESERLKHLLSQPALVDCEVISEALSDLEPAPALDNPDVAQHWVEKAKRLYQSYALLYSEQHQRFWNDVLQNPIWTSSVPRLAYSTNVSLSMKIDRWSKFREEAMKARCTGLTSVEFQPACRCGYLMSDAPIVQMIRNWEQISQEIRSELRGFFQQESVKELVARWLNDDPPADKQEWERVREYLDGKCDYPDLMDFRLLDKLLSGLETFQTVESAKLLSFIEGRTWDREILVRDLSSWLQNFQPRVRFVGGSQNPNESQDLVIWTVRESLATGRPLPALGRDEQRLLAERIEPSWVTEAGLRKLEGLGLGEKAIDEVVRWTLEERLPQVELSRCEESEICRVISWMRRFPTMPDVSSWVPVIRTVHGQQERFSRLCRTEWLRFLDQLANWDPGTQPKLIQVLDREVSSQWLCVDAMGILILKEAQEALDAGLKAWRLESVQWALVESPTSTDHFYRTLIDLKAGKPLAKINALDTLLHHETSYDDVVHKTSGVLGAALRKTIRTFDVSLPVIVFADHGFRLNPDGRGFSHGGSSTLERIVPVLKWVPK